PRFGTCCDRGKVRLPPLADPPKEPRQLYLGQRSQGSEFRNKISQYNAVLAFTPPGVNVDEQINQHTGVPYVFRIHGSLCHRAGTLLLPPGQRPAYAQLYTHDPQAVLDRRMARNGNL
ncbi:hypothetical protein BOTBODRAFT_87369, partial [Botryobasidium botryosum FD-172 SS1]